MRELSLFSGAGGGLLGTHLLGWTPIGYVEIDDYCQRVIAQRIADGILPVAPIFGDVRQFVESGAAAEYRGFVDVVTGGFPCQPFSVAGKQLGANDSRNMWPATIATIRAVRPRYAFLENVPGILSSGYFGTILGDLAESGYDCRWRILSAAELGAPHKRDRLWIVAYSSGGHDSRREVFAGNEFPALERGEASASLAAGSRSAYVAHAASEQDRRLQQREISAHAGAGGQLRDTASAGLSDGQHGTMGRSTQRYQVMQPQRPDWWEAEPALGRVVDELSDWLDFSGTTTAGAFR